VLGEVTVDPKRPTLILYNHYDVQPVDPLHEWTHDPFAPVVDDGRLFGRGGSDTKGNVVAQALAQAVIREVLGTLPLNLRFMVEGEEEVGSPHLPAFARRHPGLFRGSAACVEAGAHALDGSPQLFMGNKGILYVELRARTADVDQHSSLAAVIPNPGWRLLAALRAVRDDRGRVLIPGFYDGIPRPSRDALDHLARNHEIQSRADGALFHARAPAPHRRRPGHRRPATPARRRLGSCTTPWTSRAHRPVRSGC
jgi:acetylornithine deacetylase/succinyl-diaminopimelate desuccinylase-like protein